MPFLFRDLELFFLSKLQLLVVERFEGDIFCVAIVLAKKLPRWCQIEKGQSHSCGPDVSFVGSCCQLLLTSHSDAQWSAVRMGRGADTSPVNDTFSLFFLLLTPSPLTLLQQVQMSPQSLCQFPRFWWAMSMTLWCCLHLVCPTGRNCCLILSAPSGTLVTWWFVLTMRLCSAMQRASSVISRLSTR